MGSSVAIDDELRKRLKILAAKYDTTQAEIIRRALDVFEIHEVEVKREIPLKAKKMLEEASNVVLKKNIRRKRVIDALNKPGIDIDELRITFNGE